jgi:glutamine amidotransferase
MFLAHVRAETTGLVQRTNCHPFRFGRWLLVHNGRIRGFRELRRELMSTIDEELYPEILGTTDSELMFYLALHFGMEEDVYEGVARMVGLVEAVGRRHGVEHPMQMTLGIADGKRLHAFRYSSEHLSRTLYHSKTINALRDLLPAEYHEQVNEFSEDARAIVSEPLAGLPDLWCEIPESTFVTIEGGEATYRDFAPL